MTKISKFRVRARKKGKTRGRPSKAELLMSALVSKKMEDPEFKKEWKKKMMNMILFGGGFTQ